MMDGLSSLFVGVDNKAVTFLSNSLLLGNLMGFDHKVTEGLLVFFCVNVVHGTNFFFWNKKNVNGGLGIDVFECQTNVIFKNNIRGNVAINDFFKKRHKNL